MKQPIVETLTKNLQVEFPGVVSYSADNLWRMHTPLPAAMYNQLPYARRPRGVMRKFYQNYADKPKLAPLVQEIALTHNIIIKEKKSTIVE